MPCLCQNIHGRFLSHFAGLSLFPFFVSCITQVPYSSMGVYQKIDLSLQVYSSQCGGTGTGGGGRGGEMNGNTARRRDEGGGENARDKVPKCIQIINKRDKTKRGC